MPATHVELYQTRPPIIRRGRPQRWRFLCRAANGKVLTVSAEAYVNRQDAVHAAGIAHAGLEIIEVSRY